MNYKYRMHLKIQISGGAVKCFLPKIAFPQILEYCEML